MASPPDSTGEPVQGEVRGGKPSKQQASGCEFAQYVFSYSALFLDDDARHLDWITLSVLPFQPWHGSPQNPSAWLPLLT